MRLLSLFAALWLAASFSTTRSCAAGLDLPDRWILARFNLAVDKNIDNLEALMRRSAKAGYTGMILSDSKFGKLGDMDRHYFNNIDRVKRIAAELKFDIVPSLFSIGYSNDLLWNDPNLIEAMPVRDALFVVSQGVARLQPDPAVTLPSAGFADLKKWSWKDDDVISDGKTAMLRERKNDNARISQKVKLQPFRQYHIQVRVKTADFSGTPEIKIIAGKNTLNHNNLKVKKTQEWTVHHEVFNSQDATNATLYFGVWGKTTGTLWWDEPVMEEVGLVNLVRRDGAPLVVQKESGERLEEGKDFDRVIDPNCGTKPWKGEYDIYHVPPVIKTTLPDGARLRVSYYHGVTVYDGQAMICPSEPRTLDILKDQAAHMHAAWGAKGYMMAHDEIRVLNWCAACERRHLDAGAILAQNVRDCTQILRKINPGGKIYVWSDMFDPNHNAHDNYYLVRGNLAGSWEGLDRDIIVVPWYFEKRDESLKWFSERGNHQVIAGYYDSTPEQIRDWLITAKKYPGIDGVMYTTWEDRFKDLERFAEVVKEVQEGK